MNYEENEALATYYKEVSRFPLLSTEEEIELSKRIEKGDREARGKLINSNLRLVITIAKNNTGDLPLEDVIQNGNCGLIRAAEKYDWRKGVRFCTYATWWIKQEMQRQETNTKRSVRLPVNVDGKLRKYWRQMAEYYMNNGRLPQGEEYYQMFGISEEEVIEMAFAEKTVTSLDANIGSDSEFCLYDVTPDEKDVNPEEIVIRADSENEMDRQLGKLKENEERVLRLRFGVDDGEERTLAEIAAAMNVSGERVRQIQNAGLRKLADRVSGAE